MSNKWNQYKQQLIRSADDKPDTTKLIDIINLLRPVFPYVTYIREPFLLFHHWNGKLIKTDKELTREDLKDNFFHRTDIVMRYRNSDLIVEVDGSIHKIKVGKTLDRNHDYEQAGLDFIVSDEEDLKLELGIPKSNKLTARQIADDIIKKIKKGNYYQVD